MESFAAPAAASEGGVFNVLVVYDQPRLGSRAVEAYRHLARSQEGELQFNLNIWRTDALRIAPLAALAARQAVCADLIFLAISGQPALPAEVSGWIEQWIEQASSAPHALALISDEAAPASARSGHVEYFREVARRAQRDFFTHSIAA